MSTKQHKTTTTQHTQALRLPKLRFYGALVASLAKQIFEAKEKQKSNTSAHAWRFITKKDPYEYGVWKHTYRLNWTVTENNENFEREDVKTTKSHEGYKALNEWLWRHEKKLARIMHIHKGMQYEFVQATKKETLPRAFLLGPGTFNGDASVNQIGAALVGENTWKLIVEERLKEQLSEEAKKRKSVHKAKI